MGCLTASSARDPTKRIKYTGVQPIPSVPKDILTEWPKGDHTRVFPWVEKVYQAATANGKPPRKAIEERFGLTTSKANYLILKAREAGALTSVSTYDRHKRIKYA